MKNRKNWVGMLVIALVFGMTVVGCDNGGGDDGPDPKTLVITMPTAIFNQTNNGQSFMVGVFPVGTSSQQAQDMTGLIAGCMPTTPGVSATQSGTNHIVTLPLYKYGTNDRWTGSGTFDIYATLGNTNYYKAGSVNISSATTSITITASNQVTQ
jgi:hypothetical protein